MKTMKPVTGCRSNCKSYYTEGGSHFVKGKRINFLHKISTHILTVLITGVIVRLEQKTRQQTHCSGKGVGI